MGAGFPRSNRLNCVAGAGPVASGPNPDRYFVRETFTNTLANEFGACARDYLRTPSTWNVDFSTMKDFRIRENHTLQFRMEMFNAPNHAAWGSPNGGWGANQIQSIPSERGIVRRGRSRRRTRATFIFF